jgi:cell shape-determining protein MreD
MRWPLALALIVMASALDVSLAPMFSLWGVAPSFALPLVAFLALLAERRAALWAALLAGSLADLTDPSITGPVAPLYLLGPHALGMAMGVSAVVQIRGALKKRSLLVLMTATVAVGLLSDTVWTFAWALRGWYPLGATPWGTGSALGALGSEALGTALSAFAAVPVGWALLKLMPWWSFPATAGGARFAVASRA